MEDEIDNEDDFTPEEPIEEDSPTEEVEDSPESEEDESDGVEGDTADDADVIFELQGQIASLTIGLNDLAARVDKLASANFDILMNQPAGDPAPAPADVDSEPENPADKLLD